MGLSKKWDARPRTFGRTQDTISLTHLSGWTNEPRPEILKMRCETQDPYS